MHIVWLHQELFSNKIYSIVNCLILFFTKQKSYFIALFIRRNKELKEINIHNEKYKEYKKDIVKNETVSFVVYRHIAEVSGGFNVDYNCLYCVYWHLYIGDSRLKVPKKYFFTDYWLTYSRFLICASWSIILRFQIRGLLVTSKNYAIIMVPTYFNFELNIIFQIVCLQFL